MIEALFNKINSFVIFKIIFFGVILSNNNIESINHSISPTYQPICKNVCLDIGLVSNDNSNSYIGLQWMVSHNMMIGGQTHINLNSNNYSDIVSHNIIGGKLILKQTESSKLIFSISANKLRYTDTGNYSWLQNSFIFLKKVKKYSAQFILDQIQIDNSNSNRINFVGGYNILNNIFLYIGTSYILDSDDESLSPFFSLGFNL